MAWDAAQAAWLDSKRRRSGGENTVRAYTLAVRQFFEFACVAPWSVAPYHAHEWARNLADGGRSPATVSLKLAACSSLYDFVQRRYSTTSPDGRHLTLWPADRANPFIVVERPQINPYGRAKFPDSTELQAILAAVNTKCLTGKRDFALLYTLSTTCRRASEILNMKWGDIWRLPDQHYAFKYRYKGGKIKKAKLNRKAYSAICAYLTADGRPPDSLSEGDYLWVPLDADRIKHLHPGVEPDPNRPISNHQANSILKKYARRAGVDPAKAHIHALRHAGARLRVEQMKARAGGVDYMELMQLLGHSSLAITQIYSQHILEDPEDPGGDAAADALLPTGPRRRRRAPAAEQERLL
jgi:site-specific recombinase XerD